LVLKYFKGSTKMKMTIGQFLFSRLRQIGVEHVFGVPGDFNLQLLEQLKEVEGIEFIGTCNELNAAYAADGYARTKGIGALVTTYGVGDLSAVCGIAGSRAEHVPVIFISGVPPLFAMESRLRVHHSLAEGNFDNVMNCLKEFTVVNTRLTPGNAVEEIDRAIHRCWREKTCLYPDSIQHNISVGRCPRHEAGTQTTGK
jgi:TPP-dependent 2-oxoacid decarboxylase